MKSRARLIVGVFVPLLAAGALGATVARPLLAPDDDVSGTQAARLTPWPSDAAVPSGDEETSPGPSRAGERVTPRPTSSQRRTTAPTGEAATPAPKRKTPARSRKVVEGPARGPRAYVAQVIRLTNAQRAKHGCKALSADARLRASAQRHSVDMAKNDYFAHDSRNGRSPFERMRAAGYDYVAAAENIAAGQRTPAEVVKGWMNSKGHRANILNCAYTEIGVGYARGGTYGTYWTQNFGKPA